MNKTISFIALMTVLNILSIKGQNNTRELPQKAKPQTNQSYQKMTENKKSLVVYFSRADENYNVGYIEKGNTEIVAELIAAETSTDLFHIEPVTPYPADYDQCTKVAQKERREKARPEIKGDKKIEDYDVIFIGYPNWWGDMPMPVYTFIERHDWHGKTVIPFCTHEGSGLSQTETYIRRACVRATVYSGLAVRGTDAQKSTPKVKTVVKEWLNK